MVSPTTRDRPERIEAFCENLLAAVREAGLEISVREAEQLGRHYQVLRRWSRRMNLSGIKNEEEIIRRHFLEPVAAAELLGDKGGLLDLGSGNGFPAVPLKVLHPELDLVMVESSERKSAFLLTVLRELRLQRARVETRHVRRISDLGDLLPVRYLTFRAIRGRDLLRGTGGPILEPGGRVIAFVSEEESVALHREPPPGLRAVLSRSLPGGHDSVVVALEPEG